MQQEEASQSESRVSCYVWILYVVASCRQVHEPSPEFLSALVNKLSSNMKEGLPPAYLWRTAQALAMVSDIYLPAPQVVRAIHSQVRDTLHKVRAKKVPMLLWALVRHSSVIAPEPDLVARVQDAIISSLGHMSQPQALVETLFVLADVEPQIPLRRGFASMVAMHLHMRLGLLSRGQYRTVVKALGALQAHMVLPEDYLVALARQPRVRRWDLKEDEAAALEQLGAVVTDEQKRVVAKSVPDLTSGASQHEGGAPAPAV